MPKLDGNEVVLIDQPLRELVQKAFSDAGFDHSSLDTLNRFFDKLGETLGVSPDLVRVAIRPSPQRFRATVVVAPEYMEDREVVRVNRYATEHGDDNVIASLYDDAYYQTFNTPNLSTPLQINVPKERR